MKKTEQKTLQDNKSNNLFSRRNFLISLGAGSAMAITGFFIGEKLINNNETDTYSDFPQLADCQRQIVGGQLRLHAPVGTACAVNTTGEYITGLLDGRRSLKDICDCVAQRYSVPHTGDLEASVAMFICSLGMAGFLVKPYSVYIYEA
jgi:hypothetical protein